LPAFSDVCSAALMQAYIDLLTDKALRPELRPHVEQEVIHV
jgi:predicted nucleotidyltransferase